MTEFSVLMSIYRNEVPAYFREALNCVFAQTLQPSEIVLVKDGPLTPELNSIIQEYVTRYPIFKVIENDTNLGLGRSLAKGVQACTHEYIARMDTDDTMPPYRFEKQIQKIEEGYDVVSCWSIIYENDPANIIAIKILPEQSNEIIKLAHRRSPICHPGCILRKSAVLKAGNYQHSLFYEDYHLWIRMIMTNASFYNIQEILYYLRTSPEQIKRRGGWQYLTNELKVIRQFYKLGFYSLSDVIINSVIRICVRLLPLRIRSIAMKKIWNTKTHK